MCHHRFLQVGSEHGSRIEPEDGRRFGERVLVMAGGDQHDTGHLADRGGGQLGCEHHDEGDDIRGEMREKAVIDRFEDGWAVLLVGDEERKLSVPREALPRGAREGHWVRIEVEGNEVADIAADKEATEAARRRIADKLNRLRRGEHLRG